MRRFICLMLLLGLAHVQAGTPPLLDREALIAWALERFWGSARDSRGMPIQPSSELDRSTVPVPTSVAYRAIEAGEISGLAEWCGLDWQPHYLALTAAARKQGMSDKQVAFVGVLHGVAQGAALESKASPCSAGQRQKAEGQLRQSQSSGLEAPNKSLERARET